jgi:outer membrane immunogenic protein
VRPARLIIALAAGSALAAWSALAPAALAGQAGPGHWAGWYIGGHGGGGSGDLDGVDQSLSGAAVGGHAGYNWQADRIVVGIEADLSWTNYDLSIQQKLGAFQFKSDASHDFLTSLRLRAGYTFGDLMVYGTGGLAYTEIDTSISLTGPGSNSFQSDTSNVSGVIGGVGLEYAIAPNVTLRGEALWFDLHQDFDRSNPGYSGNEIRGGISYYFK